MRLRPRDRVALGAISALALVVAFYVLALRPEQNRAATLATAIAGQRRALAQAQSSYAVGRAAQASLKARGTEWAALRRAVPSTSNIPGLLRVLERDAKAVHVQMQAIDLSGSSGSTGATGTTSPTPSAGGATSVPLQLTFAGGYPALDNLVRRLEGLVVVSGGRVRATGPLLSIGDVSLSRSPKLTVQLDASIYQLKAAPATAAGATAGQP